MSYWNQTKMKMRSLIIVSTSFYFNSEAVVRTCSVKKVFLEISRNSQENTCTRVSFYFIKKETLTQVISCEFCEISTNTSGGCFCHLSKYFDKLYGNIAHMMQIQMGNFSQVPASLVFATISEFWFSGFSRHNKHKLITAVTTFDQINDTKLDQMIWQIFHMQTYFVLHMWNIFEHP